MKQKTKLMSWLVAGCVLGLGPVWGMLGTAVGMSMAFDGLGSGSSEVGVVAESISLALWTTAVGWIVFPVGVVIIVISIFKMDKLRKEEKNGCRY